MEDVSAKYRSEIPDAQRYTEVTMLIVMATVSTLANCSLWAVILSTRSLRAEPYNTLLLSLSLADLLVTVVAMPITTVTVLMARWVFSSQTCTAMGFMTMLTLVSSVMSLGFISVNRYIRICQPQCYKRVYTNCNVFFMTVGVWLLSALLSSPPLLGWCVYDYLPRQSICFCDWSTSVSYTFFMVTACFGGPLFMMSVCSFRILQTYRNSQRRLHMFRTHDADRTSSLPPPRAAPVQSSAAPANGSSAATAAARGRHENQPPTGVNEDRDGGGGGRDDGGDGVSAHEARSTPGKRLSVSWPGVESQPAVTVTSLGNDCSRSWTKATSSSSKWLQVQPALTVINTTAFASTTWQERSQPTAATSAAQLGSQAEPFYLLTPGRDDEDDDASERFQSDDELVSSAPAWTVTFGKRGTRSSDAAGCKTVMLDASDVWERRTMTEDDHRSPSTSCYSTSLQTGQWVNPASPDTGKRDYLVDTCSSANTAGKSNGPSLFDARTTEPESTPRGSASSGACKANDVIPSLASGNPGFSSIVAGKSSNNTDTAHVFPACSLTIRPSANAWGDTGNSDSRTDGGGKTSVSKTDKHLVVPNRSSVVPLEEPETNARAVTGGNSSVKAKVKTSEEAVPANSIRSPSSPRRNAKYRLRAEEFQLALSLMVVIVVFVLCWLPFCITIFLSVFAPGTLTRGPDMFTLLLGYSNSFLNPIIYGVMNKRVKEGYRALWNRCVCCRRRRRHHRQRSQAGNHSLDTDTGTRGASSG